MQGKSTSPDGGQGVKKDASGAAVGGAGAGEKSSKKQEAQDRREIPWISVAVVVLISSVVLLVGLPLGAVWLVNNPGCCLVNGPENVVTFWASMSAGFLALFGMLVTAVFIITAFRVDATARDKAQIAAQEEFRNYIKHNKCKLHRDLCELEALAKKTKQGAKEACESIAEARRKITERREEASNAISAEQETTEGEAKEARKRIADEEEKTREDARNVRTSIAEANKEVEAALKTIGEAREEAEVAANALRELADRARRGPDQPAGGP